MTKTQKNLAILKALETLYPDAGPELHFSNPYEALVATMLSAQSTDVQVNKVTPAVFRDFPTVADMAAATPEILLPYVRSCGFRSKATNIVQAARDIMERFDGFWGAPAIADNLIFRWSAESAQRLVELQSGTVDGIDNPGPDDFETITSDANLQLQLRSGTNIFYVGMNNTFAPFDNERVRQ
ncbi:MAG TPA: ABC transporter substrate-binding protein, partial [Clostridia bacterium]|nr:ABC transporter substrate-binding protein [Clostridia bacterium]